MSFACSATTQTIAEMSSKLVTEISGICMFLSVPQFPGEYIASEKGEVRYRGAEGGESEVIREGIHRQKKSPSPAPKLTPLLPPVVFEITDS